MARSIPVLLLPFACALLTAGCSEAKLDGIARDNRLHVHDYAVAACRVGLIEAARVAPEKPVPDGGEVAVRARLERRMASLDGFGTKLPSVIPAPFREQALDLARNHGRRLWRDRLNNAVPLFTLDDGCREHAEAHFMTFRAYRQYGANGRITSAPWVSDVDLVQVGTERRLGAETRQRRPDDLAGSWGDVAGCRAGRRFVFADGELRMDPVAGKAGEPVEYLPMRLVIDEYRAKDGVIEVVADSGETLQLEFPASDRLVIRPENVLVGSVCSAISAAGVILRCPG